MNHNSQAQNFDSEYGSAQTKYVTVDQPESVRSLDLTKSGLLEASAGTGKTYAIEHLVLRMLMETENLELPEILVLTFTEKTTSELKEKIRARIATRISQGGIPEKLVSRLKRAHMEFDRASIYTIHGFCQRVLRKYAFENNSLFRQELQKNRSETLEKILFEEMRSTWLRESGPGLEGLDNFRDLANALGFGGQTRWVKRIVDVALGFNSVRGDKLLPEYNPENVEVWEKTRRVALQELSALFPNLVASQILENDLIKNFTTIKYGSDTSQKKGLRIIVAVLESIHTYQLNPGKDTVDQCLLDFWTKVKTIALKSVIDKGFASLYPTETEDKQKIFHQIKPVLDLMEKIREAFINIEKEEVFKAFAPRRKIILDLQKKERSWLEEKGLLTFDGMIENVCLALREKNERIEMLRRDYRFCVVDEFQDTDPLQWDIFNCVFLKSGSANPLYLIGDPKQAIYRFRGGDVYTYMEARKEMLRLSQSDQAQGIGLNVNFRSSEKMVSAYNTAFTHRGWFQASSIDPTNHSWRLPLAANPLGYVPVECGSLVLQKALDTTAFPMPIHLKPFSLGNPNRQTLVRHVNHWIATEIANLMRNPELMRVPDKVTGELRNLAWGDICVLVRKRKEKDRLEAVLSQAGIPVQVTQRSGLYQGDAAGQYLAVLESLKDPNHSEKHACALLTRFFRFEKDAPSSHPPESPHFLFEEWVQLAETRKWQTLFHAMQYRSGLLFRESLEVDADRRIMDFIHVGQNLVQIALAENLALGGLVQQLRDLRATPTGRDDDSDMHREESEGGKVVLMTMHVSKGLEFPVVFLANFSTNKSDSYLKYRDGLNTIYQLDTKDLIGKIAFKAESEGEDRRLFYVALTRARYKIFVPLLPAATHRTSTGPLGGFVAEALITAAALRPELYHIAEPENYSLPLQSIPPIPSIKSDPVESWVESGEDTILSDYPREDRLAKPDANFSRRRRRVTSYTQLVRHGHGISAENLQGRFDKDEAPPTPKRFDEDENSDSAQMRFPANRLPRGKDMGTLLHEILEKIDFQKVADAPSPESLFDHAPTRSLIEGCMLAYRMDVKWQSEVADLVWNTLNVLIPDPAGGTPFRLSEVLERLPEMEFLFPYPLIINPAEHNSDQGPDGYLGGFIDLVLRIHGRYYLLDWKSNHLEEYDSITLDKSMRESRYDIQYILYTIAIDKWLNTLIPNYDFETHFGGIVYIYLRGMRALDRSALAPTGVFSLKPTLHQITTEYPSILKAIMDGTDSRGAGQPTQWIPALIQDKETGSV